MSAISQLSINYAGSHVFFRFFIVSTVSLLSVEYHPKISEELSTDFNHFRNLTKTAYHLLTTTHILDRSFAKGTVVSHIHHLFSW